MALEPSDMVGAVAHTMAERTGCSLEQWVERVEDECPDPLNLEAVRTWLRTEHGLPRSLQWAVAAARRHGWEPPTVAGCTDAMYTGKQALLRPPHEAVVEAGLALGDVETQGRAGYIPLVHRTQLAAVGPVPTGDCASAPASAPPSPTTPASSPPRASRRPPVSSRSHR